MLIEIEDIAELLDCTITAANTIVGNKKIWLVNPCSYRQVGSNYKRQWDKVLATHEAERIMELKEESGRNWKKKAVAYNGWEMANMPVTQFPQNKHIREYFKC